MSRKQLEAYQMTKAERREQRKARQKSPVTPVHDRRATDLPKGVIPAVTDVPDPYDAGGKITVIRNVRGDVLAQMFSRNQIDRCQFEAGRKWQAYYDAAAIGGIKAMDTTKEPVDGGGIVETLTEKVLKAVKALAVADRDLGLEGRYLLVDVLGKGYSIEQASVLRGANSARDREFWGKRFRECLDTVAVSYNLADRRLTRRANQSR